MISNARAPRADRTLLVYLFGLTVVGLVALNSAAVPMGYDKFHDAFYFVKRQFLVGILPGVILLSIAARLRGDFWRKYGGVLYIGTLVLLVLALIPGVGAVINGTRGWVALLGYTFQPSELAKLAVIVVLAKLLTESDRDLSDWKNGLLPILTIISPAILLILLQPDIGTLSILVVIIFAMLYLARIPHSYLLVMGLLGVIAFGAIMVAAPYRVARLNTFLHPELDPMGVGYHINQSFLAIGSGGLWGLGYGHSRQKFQYLPEVNADSIFAVIAEEMGFVVSSLLIILILLIGWRCLRIAKNSSDEYARLLVAGIVVWYLWQSFLNIGAMAGVLPLTGVPLPLISQGGSSAVTMLLAFGVILGVSRE